MKDVYEADADERNPSGRKPLTLGSRTAGAGTVKQNFPRGRSKAVVVEKKRKRAAPGHSPVLPAAGADPAASVGKPVSDADKARAALAAKAKQLGLSEEELIKRQRAIAPRARRKPLNAMPRARRKRKSLPARPRKTARRSKNSASARRRPARPPRSARPVRSRKRRFIDPAAIPVPADPDTAKPQRQAAPEKRMYAPQGHAGWRRG